MERTFKRKMSSARICQSGDLLHFTHCVGRAGGRTNLHMPRGGEERRGLRGGGGEAGLTGLILIARGRSVGRSPVLTLSSNPKEEERSKRPQRRTDRGRRRGDESKKTRRPRPTTDAYRVSRKIRTKREVWGRTQRNAGRTGEGNLIGGRPGSLAVGPHFCLGGEKTWP